MVLDIIILVLIAFGFYSGYSSGIIKTLFAIVSVIVSIAASFRLAPVFADIVSDILKLPQNISIIVALLVTFFVFLIFIRFIGKRLESVLSALNINVVNKLAGGVLMAILYTIVLSTLLGVVRDFKILDDRVFADSAMYPVVKPISQQSMALFKQIQPDIKRYWDNVVGGMDNIRDNIEPLVDDNVK